MKCSKCGMELKENEKFCSNCGNKIISEENLNQKTEKSIENININIKQNNNSKLIIIIIIILVILGSFSVIDIMNNKSNTNEIKDNDKKEEITKEDEDYKKEEIKKEDEDDKKEEIKKEDEDDKKEEIKENDEITLDDNIITIYITKQDDFIDTYEMHKYKFDSDKLEYVLNEEKLELSDNEKVIATYNCKNKAYCKALENDNENYVLILDSIRGIYLYNIKDKKATYYDVFENISGFADPTLVSDGNKAYGTSILFI